MLVAAFLGMFCEMAHADFKYTQSGQFTNGVAQVKAFLGIQATEITVYVQDPFLRIDLAALVSERNKSVTNLLGRAHKHGPKEAMS
jgi:hypothetical protein